MSHTIYPIESSLFASLFARISKSFGNLPRTLRARKMYRSTFNSLNMLSNRELQDIGISRSDIRRIAIESAENVR